MYKYDNIHNKDRYDELKIFCNSEKVNEEYMRTLLFKETHKLFANIITAIKAGILILINVIGARHQ